MHSDVVSAPMTYRCGEDAVSALLQFSQSKGYDRFMLVCDQNTYRVLGEAVEVALHAQGWQVIAVVLEGEEVIANEEALIQVLMRYDAQPRLFVAVGAGTITDITRFCSHRTGNPFVSLPTAPSVDGFASSIAPVVIRGFKDTAYCMPPLAVFADLDTLCHAPKAMIAAGFGDMLGKYTALADWRLAHLLWDEPYRAEIAARMEQALSLCVENVAAIAQATPQGITRLMDGLVESGICMILNGNSRPASGAEHHLSHYWEMKLLRQGRRAILHGAKVGIGTVLIARQYEQVRQLAQVDVDRLLAAASWVNPDVERQTIRAVYGPIAPQVEHEQRRFLSMSPDDFAQLKQSISRHWSDILQIAATVPPPSQITAWLEQVSAPSRVEQVGLDADDEAQALQYAHYLRSQFTVTKLGRVLGLC